jgi:hypothetical protein
MMDRLCFGWKWVMWYQVLQFLCHSFVFACFMIIIMAQINKNKILKEGWGGMWWLGSLLTFLIILQERKMHPNA